MQGYSDRINHALAFAAKHHAPRAPSDGGMPFVAHPANVAIILARHGADETTLVAGILHHVLEVCEAESREELARKIGEKFGSVVLGVARDAVEPSLDGRGDRLVWTQRKRLLLAALATMEPRALDICCADEIHQCGTAIALVERLGVEYLPPQGFAPAALMLTWYGDLDDALTRRDDWPGRALRQELGALRQRLAAAAAGDR
ncbi:MAG: HD domain-containing protein [Gemmatimonadetes bacterium]|nr:HD domain-containing protein [Gemmatimonadota bacterium]